MPRPIFFNSELVNGRISGVKRVAREFGIDVGIVVAVGTGVFVGVGVLVAGGTGVFVGLPEGQ
jgi:hypothetical protein